MREQLHNKGKTPSVISENAAGVEGSGEDREGKRQGGQREADKNKKGNVE